MVLSSARSSDVWLLTRAARRLVLSCSARDARVFIAPTASTSCPVCCRMASDNRRNSPARRDVESAGGAAPVASKSPDERSPPLTLVVLPLPASSTSVLQPSSPSK